MKLTRLHLQDFRCFGSVDFDLTETQHGAAKPLDVVLLVGENGSGKSSVLKAVSGEFTNLWSGYGGDRLTERDVRFGASDAHVAIHWQDQFGVDRRSKNFAVRVTINEQGNIPDDEYANTDADRRIAWIRAASSPSRKTAGIITSFDVFRLIPPKRVVGPNNQEVIRHRGELALAPTIFQDGQIRPRANSLKQWIVNLDYLRTKAKADRQEELPIWACFDNHCLTQIQDGPNYTFRRLSPPGRDDLFLAIVHFRSKLYNTPTNQTLELSEFSRELQTVETSLNHQRTIVVGDFNANPFETCMVAAGCLNAVMDRRTAGRETRQHRHKIHPFFYNPMWGLFGDGTRGPPGTYYHTESNHDCYYWNIFDQVLVRPELLNRFRNDDLHILEGDGMVSFRTSEGLPRNSEFSDHLPILFKLDV